MAMKPLTVPMVTDDEVVAISVRLEAPWRTILPTVTLEPAERALVAMMRGSRSLYVRGLLDAESDELDPGLLAHFQALGERPVRIAVYAADTEGEALDGSAAQYFFAHPGDEHWLCDAISAGGVHTWGSDSADSVESDALRAITDVFGDGVQGYPDADPVLMVVSQATDEVRHLEVSAGSLRATVVQEGVVAEHQLESVSPEAALNWLLGR